MYVETNNEIYNRFQSLNICNILMIFVNINNDNFEKKKVKILFFFQFNLFYLLIVGFGQHLL